MFVGVFDAATGWTTESLVGTTTHAPAVAVADATSALVALRASSGSLDYATWGGASWSALTPVGPSITTRERPSAAAAAGGEYHLAFHGDDFKHYFGVLSGSVWSPAAEAVGGVATQAFGPSPGSLAFDGAADAFAYAGNNGDLVAQARAGGVWSAAQLFGLSAGAGPTLPPAVCVREGGADLVVVLVRSSDGALQFATRAGGVWSAVGAVPGASSQVAPSLAPLPGGGAVVAFRGTNGLPYASVWDPVQGWDAAPTQVSVLSTPSTPVVTRGVGGQLAELVMTSGGQVLHARLGPNGWVAPVVVGGDDEAVLGAASAP